MTTSLEELGTLVRNTLGGKPTKFRPCAYFDERLDCIRVLARDCSVFETRLNKVLTVLEDNYYPATGAKYVGFTIKGARYFCEQHKLDISTPVEISKLLDALLTTFPEPVVQIFVDGVARPLVDKEKIKKVDITGRQLQPAHAL
jgi:hypothetical protein